jgi:ribosomal protein S18 acetylase RimI-like enzyme
MARLVLLSAAELLPAVFGPGIGRAVEDMAAGRGTLFSHEHAWVAEEGGEVRGMLLGYPGAVKAAQDPRTGLALLVHLRAEMIHRLPSLLRMQSAIGHVGRDEFYVSNVAVYPQHRGRGIGSLLVGRAREAARLAGISSLVLDVETDNPDAQRLYERLGFRVTSQTPDLIIRRRVFAFRRMRLPM